MKKARDRVMPESLLPLAASIPPEGITALVSSSLKGVWAFIWSLVCAIVSLFIGLGKWFYNRQEETKKAVSDLEKKHTEEMASFFKSCGERHEREFTRSTDFATKNDIETIHNKLDGFSDNIQSINNNIALIATKVSK